MSVDIIEIALDGLTDPTGFEKLSSEIMRDEGYPDIKPLGGIGDMGVDASGDRFFLSEGKTRTVFQYTLQETLSRKIEATIQKLAANNIQYHELVIVTPRQINPQRQTTLAQEVRRKYGIRLAIYERKVLVNRLANLDNGIFHRHFPDIQKQVADLISRRPLLSYDDSTQLRLQMLKVSLCFTFGKESHRARRAVFDSLMFAMTLEDPKQGILVSKIAERYRNNIGGTPPPDAQIQASLQRLQSSGFVTREGEYVRPTRLGLETEASCTIEANSATDALITDIVEDVCSIVGEEFPQDIKQRIAVNTREVLVELFRLFGIELANQVLGDSTPVYLNGLDVLLTKAKRQLPGAVGDVLVAAIAETISSPTQEQAETLKAWALAYLGVEIMNLDPNLKEFQTTRFALKTFILDTDFILDCLVEERPISSIYRNLIQSLINAGCKVIVPECCLNECVEHASISPASYKYFRQGLLSLSETIVKDEVHNVFVQGYYYGRTNSLISPNTTFDEYLRNYYEPKDPVQFLRNAIYSVFPKGVTISDPSKLLTQEIPKDQLDSFSDKLLQLIVRSKKGEHRSKEANQDLAKTDAKLFLTTLYLNGGPGSTTGQVLGGSYYLITASARHLRSASSLGFQDVVTTRPQSLIALLELTGGPTVSPSEFTKLFENPLLIYAVTRAWNDVQGLIQSGIQLRGKSLARLSWDLDQTLHQKILAVAEADTQADAEEKAPPDAGDSEYIELLRSAASRGYKRIPELEVLMTELEKERHHKEKIAEELDKLSHKYEDLDKVIVHFGKKKQRYLRRIQAKKQQ